jgi:glycosyltransferase involved in cell wall biosynthesis
MKYKKRVLFYYMRGVIDGGSDHSLFYHLANLDKNKFEPVVLYRDEGYFIESLRGKNIKVIKHKFFARIDQNTHNKLYYSKLYNSIPGSKTILFFFRSFIEIVVIINVILKYKINILHLNHSVRSDKVAAISGIILRKKIFVHSRAGIRISKFEKFLLNYIEKIICISDYTRNQHILLGVNPSKCITIYNGLDTSIFQKVKNESSTREITIGFVGRMEKWKGLNILLRSIELILKQYEDIEVLIVGDGDERRNLENLTKKLQLSKNVKFLGKVTNMIDIYSSIDIFAHTSVKPEPFGRVVIEAMASGLPVISTNIGGPKEIITNEYDGFLIEPGKPEILAQRIIELIRDHKIRTQIGNAASETIRKKFNISITTQKIEELYELD